MVERERVGGVEGHEHRGRARGGFAVVDLDAALGECCVVVGDGTVGVGIEPGLVDQHADAVRVEPPRLPGQQPVRVRGRGAVEVA